MCYSARIVHDYRRYLREHGAALDLDAFVDIFWRRRDDPRLKLPKAMEDGFLAAPVAGDGHAGDPADDPRWHTIRTLIAEHRAGEAQRLERELFVQKKRLADAERKLGAGDPAAPNKAATESRRIAGDKIERALGRLADLGRTLPEARDERIFPGVWAPVIVEEGGRRIVRPMRYQCRPAGKPASHDRQFPGTYNARRDSLGGYWRGLFGVSHGVIVVGSFFENVARTRADGSTANVVLEFTPRPAREMLVACLWSRWSAPGEPELLSFAAITDEPPAEVAAAGHDRCVVALRPAHLDRWLAPAAAAEPIQTLQTILEDREPLVYAHALAA